MGCRYGVRRPCADARRVHNGGGADQVAAAEGSIQLALLSVREDSQRELEDLGALTDQERVLVA
jgi:ribosomal protein S9